MYLLYTYITLSTYSSMSYIHCMSHICYMDQLDNIYHEVYICTPTIYKFTRIYILYLLKRLYIYYTCSSWAPMRHQEPPESLGRASRSSEPLVLSTHANSLTSTHSHTHMHGWQQGPHVLGRPLSAEALRGPRKPYYTEYMPYLYIYAFHTSHV